MAGYFITLEGGEGAGKTTAIQAVCNQLTEQGYDVVLTREPGGIEISEKIRHVILDVNHTEMEERTEALLYAAARRQHLIEKVIPALEAGKIVICDRFIDSSLAYQGYARGIGVEAVLDINTFAIESWMPSLTLFFDILPEKGLARIAQNETREINRLDIEKLDFHQKVYEGYQLLLKRYPERIRVINAENNLASVEQDVLREVLQHISKGE